jgi:hypothetical protein
VCSALAALPNSTVCKFNEKPAANLLSISCNIGNCITTVSCNEALRSSPGIPLTCMQRRNLKLSRTPNLLSATVMLLPSDLEDKKHKGALMGGEATRASYSSAALWRPSSSGADVCLHNSTRRAWSKERETLGRQAAWMARWQCIHNMKP